MVKIYLVDDHELIRTGIRRILEVVKGFEIVGESGSGDEAVKWCRQHHADVILMDMNMPGISGLEATQKILRINPDIKIIMLTIQTENPFPSKVMKAGAAGYLTKGTGAEEVINAIRAVHSGQRYISTDIAQQMALNQFSDKNSDPFQELSERELQIMLMITRGEKVQSISEQLNLSAKTVNSYRYRMFEKLNVNGDVELTHLAIRYGIINSEAL